MKTITKKYNLYTFKELSEEAQNKVIEKLHDINTDYDWYNPIIEGATENLEKLGFEDVKIYFSGFYSQGDGASFTAKINMDKFNKTYSKKSASAIITKRGNYEHEMTMGIEMDLGDLTEKQADQFYKLEDKILNLARSEARKIYKQLQTYCEELESREAIIETIEANEYTFLKDGTMFNA